MVAMVTVDGLDEEVAGLEHAFCSNSIQESVIIQCIYKSLGALLTTKCPRMYQGLGVTLPLPTTPTL